MMLRVRGVIARLAKDKGFGFIIPDIALDSGKPDLFFHATAVRGGGSIDSFQSGDVVTFELVNGKQGPQAAEVEFVERPTITT